MTDLTPDRLADWEGDPNDWPHTPPLDVWAKLTDRDSNFVWRVDSGHLINLLEAAIAALEAKTAEVERITSQWRATGRAEAEQHRRAEKAERERDEARARAERLTPKQPDGWSTQDRQEAKQEAERRWTDDRDGYQSDFDRGGINGFILGAEWQKARGALVSYKTIADRAEAALERVRALHRKAHAIFSWSEGGVRYEEPCENCNGAPGVHDCGCWADLQVEYVCAECDRGKGKHRDSSWPCATIQAIEGAAR